MVVGRSIVRRRLIKRRGTQCPAGDWDNQLEGALRPKMCKLACRPTLARAVSAKLRRKWSPEQVAGWLKRAFPREAHKKVSHALTGRVLGSNLSIGTRRCWYWRLWYWFSFMAG
jgi:IS30 family transposase